LRTKEQEKHLTLNEHDDDDDDDDLCLKFVVIILSLMVAMSRQNINNIYNSITLFKHISSNRFPNSIIIVEHRRLIGEPFSTRES